MSRGVGFKAVRSVIVIAAALAVAFLLVANRPEPEKQVVRESIPVVETLVAKPGRQVMEVKVFGTVKPRQTLKISGEVPGRVDYLNPAFVEGGLIKKGEIIMGIDPRTFRLNLESARTAVRLARADIARLTREIKNLKSDIVLARANQKLSARALARFQALGREEFVSKTSLDQAEQRDIQARISLKKLENNLAVTDSIMARKEAVLAGAELDLEQAELALEKTEIRCGFDGFVVEKRVEPGEFVSVGQPLGTLYAKGLLDVEVSIPMDSLEWIAPVSEDGKGPRALVRLNSQSEVWPACLVRSKAVVDERTRTLPVVLEIDTSGRGDGEFSALRPGSFVQCTIEGKTFDSVFVFPRHILRAGRSLFVLDNGRLVKKEVEVLRKFQEDIYVGRGIDAGDKVIVTPLPGAVEGMRVQEASGTGETNHP